MLASHVKRQVRSKKRSPSASVQAVDPDLFRLLMVVFHHKKTPAVTGVFQAADGIRTHDLLHGKQTL